MSYILDKAKDDFLTLDVGDKLVNTDDTALITYEKKFMQKAVKKPCLRNKFLRKEWFPQILYLPLPYVRYSLFEF